MSDDRPIAYWEGTVNAPVAVFRASGLSRPPCQHACALQGVPKSPPPAKIQAAYDAGSALEPLIVERLIAMGWQVTNHGEDQLEFDLRIGKKARVRVHPDGLCRTATEPNVEYVLEIKTVSPKMWDQHCADPAGMYGYLAQFSVEMLATERPLVVVSGRKNEAGDDIDELHITYYKAADLLGYIDIAAMVSERLSYARRELVDAMDGCPAAYNCPYWKMHEGDIDDGGEVVTFEGDEGDELGQMAKRYNFWKSEAAEMKRKADLCKADLIERLGADVEAHGGGWKVKTRIRSRQNVDLAKVREMLGDDTPMKKASEWVEVTAEEE